MEKKAYLKLLCTSLNDGINLLRINLDSNLISLSTLYSFCKFLSTPFFDATLHWIHSLAKCLLRFHISLLSSRLPWSSGCCFELNRECQEKYIFFYCRTCLEHIVSEQDLKDPFNQTQITVHGRVSGPSLQGIQLYTTPTHLSESEKMSFGWTSRCEDEILGCKICRAPRCPTVLWTEVKP